MPHAGVLDQPPHLGKPLAGSVIAHAGILAALLLGWTLKSKVSDFGDPHPSPGSVGVTMVKTIPIPAKTGRVNRLANDTESVVPQAPPKPKVQEKVLPPEPKAIPLPSRNAIRKPSREETSKPVYRPETVKPNQVFSHTQEALKSPNFAMQGSNGVGVGPNTPLGNRFGFYVQMMRDRIASKWNRGDLPSTRPATILFTILRDGTIRDVQLSESSGNYALDMSARRAVMDANPLPALPPQYEKDEAKVELMFQIKQ